MNTGAEAVETAIKTVRRWGYEVKGVPDGRARIVVMAGNFHGRTTTIISFSDDPVAHDHYGPYTPGFDTVPFGDIEALEAAITDDTVAVLLEPIQGEGGVILPPDGWLRDVRELTRRRNVLMVADEIQSGLGRTGTTFACDVEGVVPDIYVLGKALGGGIVPVSAVVANRDVLGVFTPGSHGSTFGGNPLAAAVGQAVVGLLSTGEFQARARRLGALLESGLREMVGHGVVAVRCRGLWPASTSTPGCSPDARRRTASSSAASSSRTRTARRCASLPRSSSARWRSSSSSTPSRDPALTDGSRPSRRGHGEEEVVGPDEGQQAAIVVAGCVQVSLAAAAWADLARRPAEEVVGSKGKWAAIIAINFVGPLAYFARGRRVTAPVPLS